MKNIPCLCIGRVIIVKMAGCPSQGSLLIQCNPYKITNDIFHRATTTTKNLKIWMVTQRPKAILKKKNGAGVIRLPDFRLHEKAIVIKAVWYCHKNRNRNKWNRTENLEMSAFTYSQLTYDRGGKTTQCWKDSLFSKCWWENWTGTW